MQKTMEMDLKVGLFVTIGLGLVMLAILTLGGADSIVSRNNRYVAHFPTVEGLISGAKVVLGGLQVGTVQSVDFDPASKDIKVVIRVARKYEEWIRKDSSAEILTQGVLGDKYISITAGTQEQPVLANGAELPNRPTKGLSEFLSKGDQLLVSLNSIAANLDHLLRTFQARNRSETFFEGMASTAKSMASVTAKIDQELEGIHLKTTVRNLNGILEKINNGTGTLGALVNDPGLYYDAKALLGGANRNRIVRNLVRKTIKGNEEAEAAQEEQQVKPKK